jgi:hypothetical protein
MLIGLIAHEQAVKFVETCAGTECQLVEELSLILKPPTVLGGHRKTFVKPTREGPPGHYSSDEDVRDLVP